MKRSTLLAILVIALCIVIGFLASSCQSKSGQLNDIPLEKVVIIDSYTNTANDNGHMYYITDYKVNRIEYGVVDYIHVNGRAGFECGDTIFYRFIR